MLKKKDKSLLVRIDSELLERLKVLADPHEMTTSDLVRKLIEGQCDSYQRELDRREVQRLHRERKLKS